MQSSLKSLVRRQNSCSAAEPDGPTAAGSGGPDQNDPGAPPHDPETEPKAAAKASDGASLLSDQLAVLPTLSLGDLRLEWRRLFRAEPPRLSRDMMMRAVAYRLQEIAHGGRSKATQRRLMTLTAEFETGGRIAPRPGPKIKPGSRLVREWHGRIHTIRVTDNGFEFQGKTYRSLTGIARDITGAQWSGPRFFGLTKRVATTRAAPVNPLTSAQVVSENADG
jgi:Protein of unknown function (DUF2924)